MTAIYLDTETKSDIEIRYKTHLKRNQQVWMLHMDLQVR